MEWTRGPLIGRGSTALVKLASVNSSGELFAVKSAELSKSLYLQKEQYILSKLSSCPYVVKYLGYDISTENCQSMYNICMEYAPAGTLYDAILRHGGKLNEHMIRSYTRNVLQGLDYLHGNIGLVHCDIKSKNILISKDGAKIADFGCAKFVDDYTSDFSGTPAFMSPEVARGEEQGFPADIWAIGCTIIEMATGQIPWGTEENDDPLSVLYKIGFSNKIPEIPEWLSENCKDFLGKCLIRDPKKRWNAKELLDHPFLDEFELCNNEFIMSSPSCVLDQDFWDSMDASETPQNLTVECLSCSNSSNSPAERIKTLIESDSESVFDVPNWCLEEDWIAVRSNEIEEKDESSMESDIFSSESFVSQQDFESLIISEELLLELFSEIENISSDSNVTFSVDGNEFVLENINFDIENDKCCLFQSCFGSFDLCYFLILTSRNFLCFL